MDILVCVKSVPDTSSEEVEVEPDGSDIVRDELEEMVNEWDNYAVEEAIRIRDRVGGTVTVVTVGGEEADEVLRREIAMGADRGVHLSDPAFEGSDGEGIARILSAFVRLHPVDLVLTGAQADDGAAQVGGMLAALLDRPFASLVTRVDVRDGHLMVEREVEGGCVEEVRIALPCVLSIQTGINEPRYVGIRGLRKAGGIDIPVLGADALGIDPARVGRAGARVVVESFFLPARGAGAVFLEGTLEEQARRLVEMLKVRGGV